MMTALRSIKRLVSRLVGMAQLADQIRASREAVAEATERSNQQIGALRDQVSLLREQVSALRQDVANLSAATNNNGANISLIYDCLIEFDRAKRTKAD